MDKALASLGVIHTVFTAASKEVTSPKSDNENVSSFSLRIQSLTSTFIEF